MAAAIGKIGEFDSATEDWGSYLERLQVANDVVDDVPVLCGTRDIWPSSSVSGTQKNSLTKHSWN